jgi:hypothetical protein
MSFKDSMTDDLKVFLNTDEFAEECSWDKSTIIAIVDDDNLMQKYSEEFSILPQGSHLVYAAENQFIVIPGINEVHVFNHNTYTINEIKHESGMFAIFLSNGRG